MSDSSSKTIIGRLERVNIPTFDLNNIEAKIDTGAYNGAIHVQSVEIFEKDGIKHIRFTVLDDEHPEFNNVMHETSDFKEKLVRNSTGGSEMRYLVPVTIQLHGKELQAQLGLSNRKDLRYPVLIGRKILKKHFIIDVSKKHTY